MATTPAKAPAKKSGLRVLKAGEVLFNDGDPAKSLYIIQKGQLRLYKPKGRGFIELAVLRVGEVLGEMAYFDDEGGQRRSCAAAALIQTEVIEISFGAFEKTIENLNPWFKTIINTLANRLRKTNARVKELESNSVSVSYGENSKAGSYEFIKTHEVMKILGSLFLVLKSHGEQTEGGIKIHRNTLNLYVFDIFSIMEVKFESLLQMLIDMGHVSVVDDDEGLPKVLVLKSLEYIRSLFIFFNTERHLTEDKKLSISKKCQKFLEKIYHQNKLDAKEQQFVNIPIQSILDEFKSGNINISVDDLVDAKKAGITGEVIVDDDNNLVVEVSPAKLLKNMPIIIFMNELKDLNEKNANF